MSGSQAVLKKSLRPVHLAAIGMGTTIGMGWVVVAGGWINDAGPGGAALAFVLGALIMGLVAQCYADLTIRLPEATNETAYVEAAFGRLYGRIIGWMVLLGRSGPIAATLRDFGLAGRSFSLMHTEAAIVLGMVQVLLPFMVLTTLGVLTRLDPRLEEAARVMGCSFLASIRSVVVY